MHEPGCGMQTAGAVTLPDAMKPAHINIEAGDKTTTQDYGDRPRKIGRRRFWFDRSMVLLRHVVQILRLSNFDRHFAISIDCILRCEIRPALVDHHRLRKAVSSDRVKRYCPPHLCPQDSARHRGESVGGWETRRRYFPAGSRHPAQRAGLAWHDRGQALSQNGRPRLHPD